MPNKRARNCCGCSLIKSGLDGETSRGWSGWAQFDNADAPMSINIVSGKVQLAPGEKIVYSGFGAGIHYAIVFRITKADDGYGSATLTVEDEHSVSIAQSDLTSLVGCGFPPECGTVIDPAKESLYAEGQLKRCGTVTYAIRGQRWADMLGTVYEAPTSEAASGPACGDVTIENTSTTETIYVSYVEAIGEPVGTDKPICRDCTLPDCHECECSEQGVPHQVEVDLEGFTGVAYSGSYFKTTGDAGYYRFRVNVDSTGIDGTYAFVAPARCEGEFIPEGVPPPPIGCYAFNSPDQETPTFIEQPEGLSVNWNIAILRTPYEPDGSGGWVQSGPEYDYEGAFTGGTFTIGLTVWEKCVDGVYSACVTAAPATVIFFFARDKADGSDPTKVITYFDRKAYDNWIAIGSTAEDGCDGVYDEATTTIVEDGTECTDRYPGDDVIDPGPPEVVLLPPLSATPAKYLDSVVCVRVADITDVRWAPV